MPATSPALSKPEVSASAAPSTRRTPLQQRSAGTVQQILADVLAGKVERGELSAEDARAAARDLFYDTPRRLYLPERDTPATPTQDGEQPAPAPSAEPRGA